MDEGEGKEVLFPAPKMRRRQGIQNTTHKRDLNRRDMKEKKSYVLKYLQKRNRSCNIEFRNLFQFVVIQVPGKESYKFSNSGADPGFSERGFG